MDPPAISHDPGTSPNINQTSTVTNTTLLSDNTNTTPTVTSTTLPPNTSTPPTPIPLPPPQPAQTATLTTLPIDILFQITTYLPYESVLSLSTTSRAFYQALNPDTICSPTAKRAFYQQAERYPQHAARFVCYVCFRFMPPGEFSDRKRTGRYGKFGRYWELGEGRFCWECGLRGRRFQHLRGVKRGGLLYYPCHWCGEARVGSQRCGGGEGECVVVVERGAGRVEELPRGVLERVCAELEYEDLLRLRQASRRLRDAVNPAAMCRDPYSMGAYVMEWMRVLRGGPGGWPGRPTACFGCFRLRSQRHFSNEQWDLHSLSVRGDLTRRRCWECLRRFYHPVSPDVAARERFHRQRLCGVCKNLRYEDEDCRGCAVHKDVIDRARLRQVKNAARGVVTLFWEEEDDDVLLRFDEDAATFLVVYDPPEPDVPVEWFDVDAPPLGGNEPERDFVSILDIDDDASEALG